MDGADNSGFMPRLGGAYCFRRVRSQRKSVDWGTMGPALGGAYECYEHISSFIGGCETEIHHFIGLNLGLSSFNVHAAVV